MHAVQPSYPAISPLNACSINLETRAETLIGSHQKAVQSVEVLPERGALASAILWTGCNTVPSLMHTTCMGVSFPLIYHAASSDPQSQGCRIGRSNAPYPSPFYLHRARLSWLVCRAAAERQLGPDAAHLGSTHAIVPELHRGGHAARQGVQHERRGGQAGGGHFGATYIHLRHAQVSRPPCGPGQVSNPQAGIQGPSTIIPTFPGTSPEMALCMQD